MNRNIIHSPMNYTGGKTKILPFLLDLFPKDINNFYDLFCGGLNVSLNVDCNNVIANDLNSRLMDIYRLIASFDSFDSLDSMIVDTILKYGLHDKSKSRQESVVDGVDFKVSTVSRDGYERLRDAYNQIGNPLLLFVLVFYSFNNDIRFNRKFEFNMPIGKSCYNASNRDNLFYMHRVIRSRKFKFTAKSFDAFPLESFNANDFVYCDPPYLITDATYNESSNEESGWSEDDERRLYAFLDRLHENGIKFGLSNAVRNNDRTNSILDEWMQKYNVFNPNITYTNASYQRGNRESKTVEVYVTNFDAPVQAMTENEYLF